MIKAYRLYTGDDGHSHIETGKVELGQLNEALVIRFQESEPHAFYDWHNAPAEQYVITLSGTLEFETYPGEKFILKPGEILIAQDTTGTAHKWKLVDDEPWKRLYVTFDPEKPVNFVADK
ncbi:cupin domain-containing protein [Mucilaginibacter oryzae]|nr:cupin domain-containing protein [Mucilaginibacter oryzae]